MMERRLRKKHLYRDRWVLPPQAPYLMGGALSCYHGYKVGTQPSISLRYREKKICPASSQLLTCIPILGSHLHLPTGQQHQCNRSNNGSSPTLIGKLDRQLFCEKKNGPIMGGGGRKKGKSSSRRRERGRIRVPLEERREVSEPPTVLNKVARWLCHSHFRDKNIAYI